MSKKSQNTKDIEKLYDHAKVANEEMATIKQDIAAIKTHVLWVKQVYGDWEKRWDRLDSRIWWVLSTVILGSLLSITINLWK